MKYFNGDLMRSIFFRLMPCDTNTSCQLHLYGCQAYGLSQALWLVSLLSNGHRELFYHFDIWTLHLISGFNSRPIANKRSRYRLGTLVVSTLSLMGAVLACLGGVCYTCNRLSKFTNDISLLCNYQLFSLSSFDCYYLLQVLKVEL